MSTPRSALSVAQRQRIEIAKALSQNARILIMDEPTASLAEADVKRLMSIVRRLRERGVGIVYVSHRLPEIFALADRVTVLRDGALIATRPIGEVDEAGLVAMMVGRSIDQLFPKSEVEIGEVVLRVEGLQRGNRVRDVSFALRRGEILALPAWSVPAAPSWRDSVRDHAGDLRDDQAQRQACADHLAAAGA